MSRKYKIRVIAHALKYNKIAKYGDIVDESELNGNAQELVNSGFVELAEESEQDEENNEKQLSEMTKAELLQFAKDNDFDVDEKLKKEDFVSELEKLIKK